MLGQISILQKNGRRNTAHHFFKIVVLFFYVHIKFFRYNIDSPKIMASDFSDNRRRTPPKPLVTIVVCWFFPSLLTLFPPTSVSAVGVFRQLHAITKKRFGFEHELFAEDALVDVELGGGSVGHAEASAGGGSVGEAEESASRSGALEEDTDRPTEEDPPSSDEELPDTVLQFFEDFGGQEHPAPGGGGQGTTRRTAVLPPLDEAGFPDDHRRRRRWTAAGRRPENALVSQKPEQTAVSPAIRRLYALAKRFEEEEELVRGAAPSTEEEEEEQSFGQKSKGGAVVAERGELAMRHVAAATQKLVEQASQPGFPQPFPIDQFKRDSKLKNWMGERNPKKVSISFTTWLSIGKFTPLLGTTTMIDCYVPFCICSSCLWLLWTSYVKKGPRGFDILGPVSTGPVSKFWEKFSQTITFEPPTKAPGAFGLALKFAGPDLAKNAGAVKAAVKVDGR